MSESYREALLGCGVARDKRIAVPGTDPYHWKNLTAIDRDPGCNPDWVVDLFPRHWYTSKEHGHKVLPPKLVPNSIFDEVHAYEVLEHLGMQGEAASFFATFNEIWRILKPGGYLCATVPSRFSPWLWGDPGHTRAILPESLVFLSSKQIDKQHRSRTSMSDYGDLRRCDFDILRSEDDREHHRFILQRVG